MSKTDKELDDLEARLRACAEDSANLYDMTKEGFVEWEAADAIAELRKEKAELEAALREISGVMTPLWQKIARTALKENTQ